MLANCLCNKYLLPLLHQWTPLYMAAEGGHKEMVRCLADSGADINVTDNNGVSTVLRVNQYCQLDIGGTLYHQRILRPFIKSIHIHQPAQLSINSLYKCVRCSCTPQY